MSGRNVPNIQDSILWTQRIEKEDKVNAKSKAAFSVRAAVSVEDVPAKFKPGHVNPRENMSMDGFDPAKAGWDPKGKEAQEFRRCVAMQFAGSRARYAYPETSYQEHGWLLLPPGDAVARMHKKKIRYGLGWVWKHPSEWSESNPAPPAVPNVDASSCLSAAPPSALSAIPESQLSALKRGSGVLPKISGSKLAASAPHLLAPSQLSVSAPSDLSSMAPSTVSKSSSVPDMEPAQRLRRREAKLAERLCEVNEFSNTGWRGNRYYRPLGMTDATAFADNFAKATGGVPLYKFGKQKKSD